MKVNVLTVVAGFAGSLILSAAASADFKGIKVENVSDNYGGVANGVVVFELYANFDNPNDTLQNVFNANITGSQNFYHAENNDGEFQATPLSLNNYNNNGSELDSFVTIGFKYSGKNGNPGGVSNPVALDPSFDDVAFTTGNSIGNNAGWFANPPTSSAAKAGTFGDLKILLGRFAFTGVTDKASISGSLQLTVKNGGTQTLQTSVIEFFASREVPAPGALALLGLAGLAGSRRRSA